MKMFLHGTPSRFKIAEILVLKLFCYEVFAKQKKEITGWYLLLFYTHTYPHTHLHTCIVANEY